MHVQNGLTHARGKSSKKWGVAFALFIFSATFIAYFPSIRGGFIWDDDEHVPKPSMRSLEGLRRVWFDLSATQQYYPLVYTALWAEHRLWGDSTTGYHIVNVLLHSTAACLVYVVLREMNVAGSALAASVFALHPVHVESVAWISEQKNTLSAVFYLGAMLAYLRFDRTRGGRWYAIALTLFLFGLLSKTVTATLPAALLVTFWWRRGTLSWRRDVAPLLPWFMLGLAGGILTAWFERRHVGAVGGEFALAPAQRLLIAGRATWFYLAKLLWPSRLVFVYPRWQLTVTAWWQWLFPAAAALTVALFSLRKWSRAPLAAWLFFVGTLFPALGFFNVYPFIYSFVADHFQYLASLGILVFTCAAVAATRRGVVRTTWSIALVGICGTLTWRQAHVYADALTLYRTTIDRNPGCWMAYNNLGGELVAAGRSADAVPYLEQAIRLKPDYVNAHTNLGAARLNLGEYDAAIEHFKAALRSNPGDAAFNYNVGLAVVTAGRAAEAVDYLQRAVDADHNNLDSSIALANALLSLHRHAEAIERYREALRLAANAQRPLRNTSSDPALLHANLGSALAASGRNDEAIEHYREAIRLNADLADPHYNLGNALVGASQFGSAIEEYQHAIRLRPDFAAAYHNLGVVLSQLGRIPQSIEEYQHALRLQPDFLDAWVDLAKAYAAAHRPDDAIAAAQRAIEIARATGRTQAAQQIEAGLAAFRDTQAGGTTRPGGRP